MDIVESVSPTMPANMEEEESEDEDEKMRRYKEAVKNKVVATTNLLCIWDCANIWLYIFDSSCFKVSVGYLTSEIIGFASSFLDLRP